MAQGSSRIAEYLQSEDERTFIHRAYAGTLGDEERLAHARKIEARDPERAEWLRLEVALHTRAAADPAEIARFIELGGKIGFDYANLLLREVIRNCSSKEARTQGPRVRFAFSCPKRWETLAPTVDATVRFCQQCQERVYHCDTIDEAEDRALAGRCIAIPKPLSDGGVESMMLGRPDPAQMWADRLFSLGPRRLTTTGGAQLVVIYTKDEQLLGRRFPMDAGSVMTIGRGTGNTLVLDGDGVSRRHALIERRADGWWVTDQASTNGIRVNDEKIEAVRLRHGDRVHIGATILTFLEP
jgi:hypothetical protein